MEIFLTFDDGPDPVETPRVLEALRRTRASATFFVITPQARRYPRLISDMQRAGHQIEFHCVEHIRHTERTRVEVEEDARAGIEDLNTLGIAPRLWRTPWGVTTPWTEEVAKDFGLQIASWTADTHDWRGDSAIEMFESIEPFLHPSAVVLMHDGLGPGALRTNCEETSALIEPLVHSIRGLGCEPSAMRTVNEAASA
ncbi:MAG: polysaccharide deacetylase family protein [Rubrobacteraceae bacterium]